LEPDKKLISALRYENSFPIEGGNFDDAGVVSLQIKSILRDMGYSVELQRRAAIVTYESELNIISYARSGHITLRVATHQIRIDAEDEGPGIEDIELAMRDGYSTATDRIREMGFGAGMGLSNIKRCSDTFEITSEPSKGTYLKMFINTE
jgi:anti-sigma regulatory factor (Ser/Thr protein kinase)